MPTASETTHIHFQDWILRYRPPQDGNGTHLIVLLHGWTGDETVMWVFAGKLPRDAWIISPRGPLPAPAGGYGWTLNRQGVETPVDPFLPAADAVQALIEAWQAAYHLPQNPVSLVGFSQGAALAYSFALSRPQKVEKIAGLAGFLPTGAERLIDQRPLKGKQIFVAHGMRDDTVPIHFADQAVKELERAGGSVIFCVSDVGHKLGAECMRGLGDFFSAPG